MVNNFQQVNPISPFANLSINDLSFEIKLVK